MGDICLMATQDGKTYQPWLAYGASKTANILFSTYLASHLKEKAGVFALQPGSKYPNNPHTLQSKVCYLGLTVLCIVPQTELYTHIQAEGPSSLDAAFKIFREKYEGRQNPAGDLKEDDKTIETASSTILAAALSSEFDGMNNTALRKWRELHVANCWALLGKTGLFLRNCKPFETDGYATDPVSAEKLWRLSEELVGQKFSI